MARVVVDVMPKPEILDPQGKAVHGALPRLGFAGVTDVRQGKRFELEFEGEVTEEVLAEVHQMAETLLSNPVIEDFTVRVEVDGRDEGRGRHLPGLARRRRRAARGPHRRPRGRSRSGTATTTSGASTPWSCRAASRTATTCAAARSPASRR